MTLAELLEVWRARHALDRFEVVELACAVERSVDEGALAKHPPMTCHLARKLRVRTLAEASRRFLAERLLGDEYVIARPIGALLLPEPPPTMPAPAASPAPKKRVHHCSICGQPGHRYETCARRNR